WLGGLRRGLVLRQDQLGAAEVRREVIDLDDLPAQRFFTLPLAQFFRAQYGLGFGHAALLRLAQLLVDRLAGDRRREGRFENRRGVFAFGHVHAAGEPVARGARLERDLRAFAVTRAERR